MPSVCDGSNNDPWCGARRQTMSTKKMLDPLITDVAIQTAVRQLNTSTANYINRAGISSQGSPSDADYQSATQTFNSLQQLQQEYLKLINTLISGVAALSTDADLTSKLQYVEKLKGDIVKLKKTLSDSTQDVDIANSRQDLVKTSNDKTSFYQGFGAKLGFSKPLRSITVPFLIGFSMLLFFISALLLKEYLTSSAKTAASSGVVAAGFATGLFSDSRFYAAFGGVLFTVVLVTILAATGRLGTVI